MRLRRSALYLPASNARAIEKARGLDADVVILDLEDAVAPDAKTVAREQALVAFGSGEWRAREKIIRINGLDTEWGADDLAAAEQMPVDAVLLPKISSADELATYAAALPATLALWAMIETPLAIMRIADIAGAQRTTAADRLRCRHQRSGQGRPHPARHWTGGVAGRAGIGRAGGAGLWASRARRRFQRHRRH